MIAGSRRMRRAASSMRTRVRVETSASRSPAWTRSSMNRRRRALPRIIRSRTSPSSTRRSRCASGARPAELAGMRERRDPAGDDRARPRDAAGQQQADRFGHVQHERDGQHPDERERRVRLAEEPNARADLVAELDCGDGRAAGGPRRTVARAVANARRGRDDRPARRRGGPASRGRCRRRPGTSPGRSRRARGRGRRARASPRATRRRRRGRRRAVPGRPRPARCPENGTP